MNFLVGLLVVTLVIDASIAVPVHDPSDDAEFIDVQEQRPRSRFGPRGNDDDDVEPAFRDFKGVVDTGVGYPFLQPMPHPLSFNLGFFDSFEDILRRLRTNFWPIEIPDAGSDAQDDFSLRIDPSKGGNTTSVVKVVDGHKIEINDTVYSNADKSGGAVFKFRIINIRPVDDSSEETDATTLDTAAAAASTTPKTIRNPITSAPKNPTNNKSDEDADINKSDERKEEIEDNKPLNNEILGNADDPEVISTTEAVIDLNAAERLLPDPAALNQDSMASADDTASPSLAPIVVGIETEELTDYGTEGAGAAAAVATTQTTPSKVQVDKEFYGNIASSVLKSEKFVINSDNVNSGDSGKNTQTVETETATSMTVHDDDSGKGDGNGDDDDDDDSVEEAEKLQSKTDNFNESISVEIQNQQTKMEQNQQLKAESEVVEQQQQQQQQHLASDLKLTMEVGEKSKDQPESNESLSMQQQQQQEEEDEKELEEQLTPKRSSNTDSQREDINSSSSEDDDDDDDDATSTSIDHEKYQKFNDEWESLAEDVAAIENENNDLNNDIDVYDNVPAIDLSNDIAINDLLAAHNAPQNTDDVEVFSVDELQSGVPATSLSSSMRRRQGRTNADEYQRRTLSEGLSSSLNIK